MKFKFLFIIFITFLSGLSAQVKTSEVVKIFEKGGEVSWEITLPNGVKLPLKWNERTNSIKGIRTFVAYQNENFVGVLSVDKTSVSGHLNLSDGEYKIATEKENIVFQKQEAVQMECGACVGHSEKKNLFPLAKFEEDEKRCEPNEHGFVDNSCFEHHKIHNDGVFRFYRLALLIDADKYTELGGTQQGVDNFLAQTEVFLNELYTRAISVKFTMVRDEKLIKKTKFINEWRSDDIVAIGTQKINETIGAENYDVGLIIATTDVGGRAVLGGAYEVVTKGSGVVRRLGPSTIGHELGHMFGADHTHSQFDSTKVEPSTGNSIMGYNIPAPRDFFTLVSLFSMRTQMFSLNSNYYTDSERKNLNKLYKETEVNPVYGVKSQNKVPVINTTKLKKKYVLPRGTYFQFRIEATDPDNDKLIYYAHQSDIRRYYDRSNAMFYSYKPTHNNTIQFEEAQTAAGSMYYLNGIYRFWLAVSDGILGAESATRTDHASGYDMFKTDVEIKPNTTPFVISTLKTKYSAGEQISIKWGVDRGIFGNDSKVRILLSDDNGQTFKHIVTSEAPNNGEFSFKMPDIVIGRGKGVFKIEVIDHIAYTYNKSGFEVQPSKIVFENTPEPIISVKEDNIPEPHSVTARTTCGNQGVQISHQDQRNGNVIKRTFTATDNCQNQATFVQHIQVEENVEPLQFVGILPQDRVYHCDSAFDKTLPNIQVIGGKSPKIELTQIRIDGDYHINYIIRRVWRVTDPVAAPIEHTQTIRVFDSKAPILVTKPQDVVVKNESEIYNYTSTPPVYYDNCGGEVLWKLKDQNWQTNEQGNRVVVLTWVAIDGTKNETEAIQRIIVQNTDEISFLHFPNDLELTCNEAVPSADFELKIVNCQDARVTHTESQRTEGNKKIISRTYTATGCSKTISRTQTITITDTEKPVFVGNLPINLVVNSEAEVPEQETLTATDNCYQSCSERRAKIKKERVTIDFFTGESKEVFNWTITGDGACAKNVPVQKNRQKTSTGYTDTWTATDEFGNTETYTRTIRVSSDPTPPVEEIRFVEFPENQQLTCGSEKPTALTTMRISGCNEVQNVSVTSEDVERGDCKTGRTIERTYTALACNQTITKTQTITIAGDNEAPTFEGNLPQNEQLTRNNLPTEQQTLTATDNCSQNVVVIKNRTDNGNTITETWTARDECGNEKNHSRTITIVASELSFVNAPSDMNVSCPSAVPTASKTLEVTANCNPRFEFNEEKQNETCKNSYTLVRTWTASDNCGNSKTHTQRIVVSDTQSPEFEGDLPKDISVKANAIPQEQTLTARDNCSGVISVQPKRTETNQNGQRTITETWTARDECGNEKTHTRRITILPEPPAPTPPPSPNPTPPIQPTPTPPNEPKDPETKSEVVVYNWVSEGTGNHHLKIENVEGKKANVKIFNELGQLVFEVSDYDNHQNVFIGEGNIGGRKRLASGVYFYILTYKHGDVNHSKTGFLVLKN